MGLVTSFVAGEGKLAVLAKARANPGTLAATATGDFGGFRVWHTGGWFVVAVSMLLLDWAMSG